MSKLRIASGPFGLRTIDVYEKTLLPGATLTVRTTGGTPTRCVVVVESNSNEGRRIADGFCDIDNPEIEEAKQWLLDFARCSL